MTSTPQQPPDAPDAIERAPAGPEKDETAERPEMAFLRGIGEHRIRRPAPAAAPATALNQLIEEFRRHPAWPIVRADAAVLLYETLLLLGAGEQAIRDALGFDACVWISQLSFGSPRW